MNIVLIGMRTTGKTTIGRALADALERDLIETDKYIALKSGSSIPGIVKKHGWDHFRDLESEVIQEVSQLDHKIISTGGGVVIREKNTKALKKNGFLILLEADVDTMVKRLEDGTGRPSLTAKQSIREEIIEVLKQRKSLYENASDVCIRTDTQNPDAVVEKILEIIHIKNI